MYNFYLKENEELVYVFDDILIKFNNEEIITTVAITTLRLLLLDYMDYNEEFRITKYQNNMRYKEPYFDIYLSSIKDLKKGKIIISDNIVIEFENNDLYKILKNQL